MFSYLGRQIDVSTAVAFLDDSKRTQRTQADKSATTVAVLQFPTA